MPCRFGGVYTLRIEYPTDPELAAQLVPAELELDDNPIASIRFVYYRFTSIGAFHEVIQNIQVRYRGETFTYTPHIFINNERGMLAGRERDGLPKLLGTIDFDPCKPSLEGILYGKLFRPADVLVATATFRPGSVVQTITPDKPLETNMMGLRVVGSSIGGKPALVRELVAGNLEFRSGELWSGEAMVTYTGAIDWPPVHHLPVRGKITATLLADATAHLYRATRAFPIGS